MGLYIHSPIRLHGVELSKLSIRSILLLLYLPRHVRVSKWGLLFDEGGVGLSMLHRSFSTSISALSRRPGHYGHCAPVVTALSNIYTEVSCQYRLVRRLCLNCQTQSRIETDGRSPSLSRCQAPIWGPRPVFCYCQTVAGLLMWGALSDERADLSFTVADFPRQRSHS
jgi:hypothetical protein